MLRTVPCEQPAWGTKPWLAFLHQDAKRSRRQGRNSVWTPRCRGAKAVVDVRHASATLRLRGENRFLIYQSPIGTPHVRASQASHHNRAGSYGEEERSKNRH